MPYVIDTHGHDVIGPGGSKTVVAPGLVPLAYSNQCLQKVIKAYLYKQYTDDEDLQAFFDSFNVMGQQYTDAFNGLNLPVYTDLSGSLLDWVAEGVYGMARPLLAIGKIRSEGPFNTFPGNMLVYNGYKQLGNTVYYTANDDLFKRVITWNFYKGDGPDFSIKWLKRRIYRFLGGVNGVDFNPDDTRQVSIQNDANTKGKFNILIKSGAAPSLFVPQLSAAIGQGIARTPFQYSFDISQG